MTRPQSSEEEMDLFGQLRRAVYQAQEENDLPALFARQILAIAAHPQRYRRCRNLLIRLLQQLPQYDTYGQTGYLGMGVNDADIRVTLRKIEEARIPPGA
jgi:hypothetical protein